MPGLPGRLLAWLFGLLLLFGAGLAAGDEPQAIPGLAARVTDLTRTLAADQKGKLEAKLAAFERNKGSQIAVLIVPTVKPESIEQYALRAVESWKLGRRGVDDGALLLVAKEDRKLRIEVGYGLEGALNDATAKRIISETISPRFKQGDFSGGIDAGIDAMIRVIGGEPLPPPGVAPSRRADSDDNFETLLFVGFVLVFVVGGVLRAIFGRLLAAGMVGVAAGVIASMLISSVLVAALLGFVACVISLFLGMLGGAGWSSGGVSWGGGGGSKSGFSGGGGSFGGGRGGGPAFAPRGGAGSGDRGLRFDYGRGAGAAEGAVVSDCGTGDDGFRQGPALHPRALRARDRLFGGAGRSRAGGAEHASAPRGPALSDPVAAGCDLPRPAGDGDGPAPRHAAVALPDASGGGGKRGAALADRGHPFRPGRRDRHLQRDLSPPGAAALRCAGDAGDPAAYTASGSFGRAAAAVSRSRWMM
mgnify:CR=1 FL=1